MAINHDNFIFRTAKILLSDLKTIYSSREAENIVKIWTETVSGHNWRALTLQEDLAFTEAQEKKFQEGAKKLLAGAPLQYVIGEVEFLDCRIKVGPGVLIPRPETEELADWILKSVELTPHSKIIDFCAGSGCIGIALAAHSGCALYYNEYSDAATPYIKKNAALNSLTAHALPGDVFSPETDALKGPYDLIVSNPPYIPETERNEMAANVLEHEPDLALFVPDDDPLKFYRRIALISGQLLAPGGWLYFEIHEEMGKEMMELMQETGWESIQIRKDLQGKERMLRARKPE